MSALNGSLAYFAEKLLRTEVVYLGYLVSLPEWSKGLRSGRNVFERVGSNPTADIRFGRHHAPKHALESYPVPNMAITSKSPSSANVASKMAVLADV